VGLEISAAFDWSRGRAESAQRKAYQALYLLREGGGVADPIRQAFALHTVSRVLGSSMVRQFSFALQYARLARKIFHGKGHPFETRATIQEARVHVKAAGQDPNMVDAARLAKAEALLKPITETELPNPTREQIYCRAEANLTLAWIASLRSTSDVSQWDQCRKYAEAILKDQERLPPRLQAEGSLQLGRAMIHRPAKAIEKHHGIEHVVDALTITRNVSRRKVAIACHLALAEGYSALGHQELALANWNQARSKATDVQSNFLRQWIDSLATEVGGPTTIDLDGTYEEAVARFDKLYLTYHEVRDGEVPKLLETTGLSLSTYYRMRDKAQLPRRGNAGRPRRGDDGSRKSDRQN
jgi:hypothetical protein